MVTTQATRPLAFRQAPPIVQELRAVFASLDDEPLLSALQGPIRRGPKGHPIKSLWHCFVAKYYMGLDSTAALLRALGNNPYLAEVCGITDLQRIPSEPTMSRFFKKLASKKYLHLVKDVSRRLVRHHYQVLPGFGKRVAMDSSTLKAWSNGARIKKADRQANWSVKTNSQGVREFVYGWKLHLLVDCETEMPISANVSPGNVHDSKRASNLLSEARYTYGHFKPQFVIADKGYSSKKLRYLIRGQYWSHPIIAVHPTHAKALAKEHPETPEFKALLKQRQAVERVFARLKGQRALNKITVRGKMKVAAHCYLSIITMLAAVSSHARAVPLCRS